MRERLKRPSFRIAFVGALFIVVCLVFFVRMFNIMATADPDNKIETGTYTRREPIQALRGEIYDRNGNLLVYNEYTYNMVFDYDAMAATQIERNITILQAARALGDSGLASHRTETSFPFSGSYPNYTYTSEARDGESDIYYRLLKRIAEDELESDAPVSKTELTVAILDEFYTQSPDAFPSESEIVDWFVNRYKLDEKNESGEPMFTDGEIDEILRVRYDMEVADFSVYNRYTFAKEIDISFITYVKELNLVGADFEVETARKYAYPGHASHILGRTGAILAENWEYYQALGYDMNDTVGLDGCEAAFEEYLRGVDGVRVVVEDKDGNIIRSYVEKEPIPGKDVYLTIDIDLQIVAEAALEKNVKLVGDAHAGALTAIDPDNGDVLVLASYPTFDLTTYNKDYTSLSKDPHNPLLNRALNAYTPGSVFKVGMVAAGVTTGTVKPWTAFYCSGVDPDYGNKCWIYPGLHGDVNAAYALQVSCNCYFYELGPRMGIENMNRYCSAFGFGEPTGIELRESTGILAGPAYVESQGQQWNERDTVMAAIGQSVNMFNPLQLSNYIATVLNGGDRRSVHLLKEVKTYSGETVYKTETEIVDSVSLSSEAVSTVKQGMKQMVANDAAVSHYMKGLPVTVGGKTGTAQRGTGKNDNRLFVCAAPYNDPEIIVSVVLEPDDSIPKDVSHGSSYASLAAAETLRAYYNNKK